MREHIRLVSSEGTGCTYYTKKNKRTTTDKLQFMKYDRKLRRKVLFVETKMPSHTKK